LLLLTPIIAGPAAPDHIKPMLLLLVAMLKNPAFPIFLPCSFDAVDLAVGAECSIELQKVSTCFVTPPVFRAELVRRALAVSWSVTFCTYEFTGLLKVCIRNMEDVTDEIWMVNNAPKRKTVDPVLKMVRELDKAPTLAFGRRPAQARAAGLPARPRAPRAVDVDDMGVVDVAIMAVDDDDDGADLPDGEVESGGESGHGDAGGELMHGSPPFDEDGEAADHGGCRPGSSRDGVEEDVADLGLHDDGPAPHEDVVAEIAVLPDLRWSSDDFQVRDESGLIIGRIKPLHVGTPKEAISFYCRHHGCSVPLRRSAQAPTTAQSVRWFSQGVQLGRGKEFRRQHEELFRQMLRDLALT
jgi:hypothetical protein